MMAIEKGMTGSGITQRRRVMATGDDMDPMVKVSLGGWSDIRARAGSDLGAAAWHAVAMCEKILNQSGDGPHEPDSEAWYAATILADYRLALDGIAAGDADKAGRFGYEAGVRFGIAVMKWRWETEALDGVKRQEARRQGGKETAAERSRERALSIEDAHQRARRLIDQGYGRRDIAGIIAEKTGKSVRTVRDYLKDFR